MKTNLIAEIAQAHDGSLGIAHSFIDALAESGIQTVKFQMHIASAESSVYEEFRIPFSYEDKSRYDYWKRMEFTKDEWIQLKNHCEEKNLEFLASPFSMQALQLLDELNVKRYKVGSGEVNNHLLLHKMASTKKPILLSNGLASDEELTAAIQCIQQYHSSITLLQCTTAYPTKPNELFLLNIPKLKTKYDVQVGFSDHSASIYPSIAALCLGAEVLEFHVCFNKEMFGPDSKASLTIAEVKELANAVSLLELGLNTGNLNNRENLKTIFGKSLAVNVNLNKGDKIKLEYLETKKPSGYGITALEYHKVEGLRLKHELRNGDFINWSDLENE